MYQDEDQEAIRGDRNETSGYFDLGAEMARDVAGQSPEAEQIAAEIGDIIYQQHKEDPDDDEIREDTQASAHLAGIISIERTVQEMKRRFDQEVAVQNALKELLRSRLERYLRRLNEADGTTIKTYAAGAIQLSQDPDSVDVARGEDGKPVNLAAFAPSVYLRLKYELDKRAAKKALVAGEEIPFAVIVPGQVTFKYRANDEAPEVKK